MSTGCRTLSIDRGASTCLFHHVYRRTEVIPISYSCLHAVVALSLKMKEVTMNSNLAINTRTFWMRRSAQPPRKPRNTIQSTGTNQPVSVEADIISMKQHLVGINQEATVCRVLCEGIEWQVKFQGSFWTARSISPRESFLCGDRVYVVGRQNLTLLIQSINIAFLSDL